MVRQYKFLEREGVLQLRTDRQKFLPWSLAGGKPGAPSANLVIIDGQPEVPPSKAARILHRGDVLRHTLAGAGGHGNPLERDPALVAEDVADEKVSLEAARAEYGVVLDPVTFAVDTEATAALRAELRSAVTVAED
jgi:N-methylhydantoinase B